MSFELKAAPEFRPHPLIRGGHLQTVFAVMAAPPPPLPATRVHPLRLPDGDQLVLHENLPATPDVTHAQSALLIHGLCGCHSAGYMVRTARRLLAHGYRVFRLDMRGCGAGRELARNITHAGRSEDVRAALRYIALQSSGPIDAIGFSLGGNQLLKALGEIPGDPHEGELRSRLRRAAAAAPPVQLDYCAAQMERWLLRPYNRYFIGRLIRNAPTQVAQSEQFKTLQRQRRPRTLREFDEQFTAPLAGFSSADDYYAQASAAPRLPQIEIPTLVLASRDDPLVPVAAIENAAWSPTTHPMITEHGGHIGYWSNQPDRRWMDAALSQWIVSGAP